MFIDLNPQVEVDSILAGLGLNPCSAAQFKFEDLLVTLELFFSTKFSSSWHHYVIQTDLSLILSWTFQIQIELELVLIWINFESTRLQVPLIIFFAQVCSLYEAVTAKKILVEQTEAVLGMYHCIGLLF